MISVSSRKDLKLIDNDLKNCYFDFWIYEAIDQSKFGR